MQYAVCHCFIEIFRPSLKKMSPGTYVALKPVYTSQHIDGAFSAAKSVGTMPSEMQAFKLSQWSLTLLSPVEN